MVRSLVPIAAALLALTGALTGMCFVKVYGIAFLGQPRLSLAEAPREAGGWELAGMVWLAIGCVLLGIFPVFVIGELNAVCLSLIGSGLSAEALASGWLWLVPTAGTQASYSPLIFLLAIMVVFGVTFLGVRRLYRGFPEQTLRMQDSADAFGQPIRQIFAPLYRIRRQVPRPDDAAPVFKQTVEDWHGYVLYRPIARLTTYLSDQVGKLQQGRISVYLLYSFVTLIALLVFVK